MSSAELPKCADCEIFAPQENGRCWACAGREAKRSSQIYTLTMGEGIGDNGMCSVCGWHCAGEPGIALQTPREVPAGHRTPALCIFCARFVGRIVARLSTLPPTGPARRSASRWPIDNNGVGPFGWRADPRAAVGVPCNVCRNQPEALRGLRMCRSCMELAARLLNGGPLMHPDRPTQNPLPTDPPQVPENTPSAEAPADPTQNDPIASACLWCQRDELRACLLEALEHNARGYGAYPHGMRTRFTNAIGRKVSPIKGCSSPSHWPLDSDPGPTFNHTRGDSPLTPCPICAKAMGAELGREIGQLAVEAAEAAEATCVTCGHRTESHITTASGSLHCWCGCKNFGLAL